MTDLKATGDLANSDSIATGPYDDSARWVGTRSPTPTSPPAIHRVVTLSGRCDAGSVRTVGHGRGNMHARLQPIVSLGFRLTTNGDFVLPAPISTGLSPVDVDVQWFVDDSAANAAGFVSSRSGPS